MGDVFFIDRTTKEKIKESIPFKSCLEFLYSSNPIGHFFRPILCKFPFFSKLLGTIQKNKSSQKKIRSFIETYKIDASEFLNSVDSYKSFNDFFIRKLKPDARPIAKGSEIATLPADGRYLVFQNMLEEEGFLVKGKKFTLQKLLGDTKLSLKYAQGSIVMARLAPVDYHRFHFPCDCVPGNPRLINGTLFSVNPIALRKNIEILTENKRVITELQTEKFGTILCIEVGATSVGSIIQTCEPNKHYSKGDEKGYFSLGGSLVILIYEPNKIQFDKDLLEASSQGLETYARMGQSLGIKINSTHN